MYRLFFLLMMMAAFAAVADVPVRICSSVSNAVTKVSYAVVFASGEKPVNSMTLLMGEPGASERGWRGIDVYAGFTGYAHIVGRMTLAEGYSGVPLPSAQHFPLVPPRPGERRRVEIVHKCDYLSVWLENDGQLRLFARKKVLPNLRLYAVQLPSARSTRSHGVVSDIRFTGAGDAPDPTPVHLDVQAPAAGRIARFALRPGLYPSLVTLTVDTGTTNRPTLVFSSFSQQVGQTRVADSGLVLGRLHDGYSPRVYTLPRMKGRYTEQQIGDMLKNVDCFGDRATKHDFLFEIRRGVKGWALWIDGSFFVTIPGTEVGFKALSVDLPSGSRAMRLPDGHEAGDSQVLALGVSKPFDTSACRCNLGNFDIECDGYLSRDAFEAHPDTFMRRVPADTYAAAIVRCRVDGAATNSCELTARLTNFHCPYTEGRSPEAMTQRTVRVPRRDGEQTIRIDFEPGKIQDLIHDHPDGFLDLELLGGLDDGDQFKVKPVYLPSRKPSGVTVLGVDLVRAPASLYVANGIFANTFVAGETACVTAIVRAVVGGEYRLSWTVADLDGRMVEKNGVRLALSAGESVRRTVAFVAQGIGWYRYEIRLADAADKTVVAYAGSYIVIAPDTRQAGYESPFFTWHRLGFKGTNEFRRFGAFLKRLGIRRTQLKNYTEADAKAFGLTLGTCYNCRPGTGTFEERKIEYERQVRLAMAKWPHIDTALIFHETQGGPAPQELVGGVTELNAADAAHQRETVRKAVARCEIWRRIAPHVKLQIGNADTSLNLMGEVLRGKVPASLFDTVGEESTGEAETPERASGWSFRVLQDLVGLYGYTNRVMACHEWKCRVPRAFYGNLRKHAAWRMRDALIALVWRSRTVPVNADIDSGAGYFITYWGGGGCTRTPLEQPYPSLAATANLTRLLDRCRFSRLVTTGSKSVYLAEFRNPEGRFVYAGWTARGEVEAKFRAKASSLVVTDLYGREDKRTEAQVFLAKLSEEPVYFTMDGPVVSASATGARRYPWESYPALGDWRVLDPLASADGWTLETEKGWKPVPLRNHLRASRPGAFDFATRSDEGRGCLSLTLKRVGELKPIVGEYGLIRLKTPIPVPEDATTIGVDVKGNSNWGKIYFELEDAKGVRWRNWCTTYQGFGDNSDTLALNFDGWHRLASMIRKESPVKCASINPNMRQWQRVGGGVERGAMTYPVKLAAIHFELRRKTFDLLNWTDPDSDTILLRDFSAAANR